MTETGAQTQAWYDQHFPQLATNWPEDAYRCDRDSVLDNAPAVPATDTAGLGAAIQQNFPGYRLTTEREIGCRFPLLDGSRPEQQWGEKWGSGRAWWVWSGDFDGDGAKDRLTILSHRAEPKRDKLVVLHGNGTSADLGEHGGTTIHINAQARSAGTRRDQIAWGNFEKPGGGHFEWNSRTRSYEPMDNEFVD